MRLFLLLVLIILTLPVSAHTINVQAVQDVAQQHHKYISDQDQYGVDAVWTPSLKGDCEDYTIAMHEQVTDHLL